MKTNPAPRGNELVGAIALLVGAGIMALGAGMFPTALQGANAPLWVILAAGGIFALAGIMLLAQGRLPEALLPLFGCLLITLFASIPAWIAWGSGPRQFTTTVGFFSGNFGSADIGRIVFGLSALLVGAMALFSWLSWIRKLNWSGRAILATGVALAAYGLIVVMPAEPRWPDVADDHERLARYALLIEDEGWLRNKGRGPMRWHFPPWRNIEQWNKDARSRLAAARTLPPGQSALNIPLLATAPVIDGAIGDEEWRGALQLGLEPESLGSSVRIGRNGRYLYLAADVPADTTSTGFDQFRFWFHLALSPWLENERAFVDGSGSVNVLRTHRFPWGNFPPRSRTDWHTHEQAQGASSVAGHRRFELALELEESGLKPGVPFPAWFEIEGDPLRDAAGKFKARTELGQAGRYQQPLWLRIATSQ